MSSSFDREPLGALLRHGTKVVGSICLPEEDIQDVIEQVNHCYGPIMLKIEPPGFLSFPSNAMLPVGADTRPRVPLPKPFKIEDSTRPTGSD